MSETLLLFLGRDGGFERWLRLDGNAVAGRGDALENLPPLASPDTGKPVAVAAIVPGDAVTVHWLELPGGLTELQAAAAARLLAAELSAQPTGELHVAVGPDRGDSGLRCVALVSAERMAEWVGRCQAVGCDPDIVLPEPLLLLPEEGKLVRHDRDGATLYRGTTEAFAAEPELAELAFADAEIEPVAADRFEAALAEAIDQRPVNLRQGAFAKRRRWKIDWKLVRRLSLLAASILLVSLAIQLALITRYTFAADRLEAETEQVAAAALPGSGRASDPSGQLARRFADIPGGAAGYSSLASAVFAAVRDTANAEVGTLSFDRGALRLTVTADGPATIAAFQQRIESAGLAVEAGPSRSTDGRQTSELTVRQP